jgi:Xaa-Pro dipeptidase
MDISELKPLTGDIVPITIAEYEARIEKARRLMVDAGIDAIYLEGGTGLYYFTGLRWGRSERMTAALLPAKGDIAYVCPAFEEDRLRESLLIDGDVRTWEEDESPYKRVAQVLDDADVASGTLGIEQQVRFFLFDGIRRAAPSVSLVSADPVTVGCRSVKSPAEIALIQRAMDITAAAYKVVISLLYEGISREECRRQAASAHRTLGAGGGIDFQFGKATAFPHGSRDPDTLREGDVVLMDGGCTVEGYHSDISRTIFFGRPSKQQRKIWDLEKAAQQAAFNAAQVGAPCEAVDAAARQVIIDAGLGPGYQLPGLPHRTGHGIGLDIHEPEHMVRGNTKPLAPGMCFTDEPMIVIEGEFGVRLEDCIYIADDGPRWFTEPAPSPETPF